MIGLGRQPYVTEYGQSRWPLLDARFVGNTSSYRAVHVFLDSRAGGSLTTVVSNSGQGTHPGARPERSEARELRDGAAP